MAKLRKQFSKKQWEACCTSMCPGCLIAVAYRAKYGKKRGRRKMKKHRQRALTDV